MRKYYDFCNKKNKLLNSWKNSSGLKPVQPYLRLSEYT